MNLKIVKPTTTAEKATSTTLDTVEITPAIVDAWNTPPFQRPIRINAKVETLAQQIRNDEGVIPGVVTLGVLDGKRYIVDGQHRREAFRISGCKSGFVDMRVLHFTNMAEMGDEFVSLNSQIVRMRPDDILRGLEQSYEPLQKLRKQCAFIGYDQIRRGTSGPTLSMSAALRCWVGSATETPKGGGASAATLARTFSSDEAVVLIGFLDCVHSAFGHDVENYRLWGNLNLTLCMWLYRRLVITPYSARTQKMTRDDFTKCLMSVAAAGLYVDWLQGRDLRPRDLSPAYTRLKSLFAGRIEKITGKKPSLPQPSWASSGGKK